MKSFLKLCLGTLLVFIALLLVLGVVLSFSGVAVVLGIVALVVAIPGLIVHYFAKKRKLA